MEYLTVQEVAERVKVNPETVKRWLRRGELRGSILGDRAGWRVSEEEVRRFMEAKQPATSERQGAGESESKIAA